MSYRWIRAGLSLLPWSILGVLALPPDRALAQESKPPGFILVPPFAEGAGSEVISGYQNGNQHTGKDEFALDFQMAIGTPVYAAAPGKVIYAGNTGSGYGTAVMIDHTLANGTNRYQTFYAHLSQLHVALNSFVDTGTQIGASGDSGLPSTVTDHLHFVLRKNATSWYDGTAVRLDPFAHCTAANTATPGANPDHLPCGAASNPPTNYPSSFFDGDLLLHDRLVVRRDRSVPAVLREQGNGSIFHVFARITGQELCHARLTWTGSGFAAPTWVSLGGGLTSGPTASMDSSLSPPRLTVFALGLGGAARYAYNDGGGWAAANWQWGSLANGLGRGRIAARFNSNASQIDIFLRGVSDELFQTSLAGPTQGSWINRGGVLSSEPVVVSDANGESRVYGVGDNYNAYHVTPAVSSTWSLLWGQTVIGPPSPALDPSAPPALNAWAWTTFDNWLGRFVEAAPDPTLPWDYHSGSKLNGRPSNVLSDGTASQVLVYRSEADSALRSFELKNGVGTDTLVRSGRVLSEAVLRWTPGGGMVAFVFRTDGLSYSYRPAGSTQWGAWQTLGEPCL